MQYLIGFIIALFIALTGVGAGTVTVPVLVLFLGVPAPVAVGIGLMFATAVKLILVPAQILRRNVAWRTLGFMLLGGVPGVIVGSLFLKHLVNAGSQNLLNAILGLILVTYGGLADILFLPSHEEESGRPGSQLPAFMADASGRRRGRLFLRRSRRSGQRRAAQPHCFSTRASSRYGHCLWLCRLAHWQRRTLVLARLQPGVADSPDCWRRRRSHRRNHPQHPRSAPSVAFCPLGLATDPWRAIPLQQLSGMGNPT